MPTDTRVRIRRNPYHGFEVWLWGNGELTRRSFDNGLDLASKLVAECVDDATIEEAADLFERLEWQEPEYPLFQPAEAACDVSVDEPVYPVGTVGYEMQRFQRPSQIWEWGAGTLRIGAVTAPWVLLMLLGRMAWGWL